MNRGLHGGAGRDAALLLVGQCFQKATGIFVLAVVARHLSADAIGMFFIVLSLAESLTALANFKLDMVVMRQVAADPDRAGVVLAEVLGFRVVSGLPFLVCVVSAGFMLQGPTWPLVLAIACSTLLDDVYECFASFFLGLKKASWHVAVGVVVQAVYVVVLVGAMWWRPSLEVLVGANVIRALSKVLIAGLLAHLYVCPLRIAWNTALVKQGIPFVAFGVANTLRLKMDTMLLGMLVGFREAGLYSLALSFVLATAFIPTAFSQVTVPRVAAEGLNRANRHHVLRISVLLIAIGLLGTGLAVALATPVTSVLYGPQSREVAPLLCGLAVLFPVEFLRMFFLQVMRALHREYELLRINILMLLAAFAVTWLLVDTYGLHGAVAARVLSAVGMSTVVGWCLMRLFKEARE